MLLALVCTLSTIVAAPRAEAFPGALDETFAGDGTRTLGFPPYAQEAGAMTLDGRGRIILVGTSWNDPQDNESHNDSKFLIVRLTAKGALDTSFSSDGQAKIAFTSYINVATAVARQADGKIVVAGIAVGRDAAFAVARLHVDGRLDRTFGGDGKVRVDFPWGSLDGARSVILQPDGKIVLAGWTNGNDGDFALARLRPRGTLDPTFGDEGRVTINMSDHVDMAHALARQPDRKIVVAGYASGSFGVARLNESGRLDRSFAGDGTVRTVFSQVLGDGARAVRVQADGRIVVAGGATPEGSGGSDFALARYTTDGRLDPTFAGDGRQLTTFIEQDGSTGGSSDSAHALALQRDGKILVGGETSWAYGHDFALVRYRADGRLDPAFGRAGKVRTSFIRSGGERIVALRIRREGQIVAAGGVDYESTYYVPPDDPARFGVAQYLSQ